MKFAIVGIIAGIINGLFGSGSGMIILPVLASNIDEIKSRGTTLMSVLFLSIISSIFYIKNLAIQIELKTIWYVVAGGIIGGALGAKIINKIPIKYLQILLAIFMIGTGIRMMLA
ncbi:MAG: sulfite exporter TauE/SafE family protein [Clostridiales bacterium]|nr:sulfite exporter TauE/SafE family protein [Clostridiales bacterium]